MLADNKPLLIGVLPGIDIEHVHWLFGHYQINYKQELHAPIFSNIAIKRHVSKPPTPYSILLTEDQIIQGQNNMFRHYEALASSNLKLLPADPEQRQAVEDWIKFCSHHIGSAAVLWSYYNILPHKTLGLKGMTTGVPIIQRIIYRIAYPILAKIITNNLKANQQNAESSLQNLRTAFDKADNLLQSGQSFFFADQLTVADTLFAAYAGPVVLAPEYGGNVHLLPTLEQAPEKMRTVAEEFRARPAGQHVLRLYQQYRLGFEQFSAA